VSFGDNKEWKETTLGEMLTFQRGFDITKKEQQSGPYQVISSSGPKSTHCDFKVKGPGVIIGRKGTLGNVFYSDRPFWPHDTTLWVKDFHGTYEKFAYYFLQTMKLEQYDCGASNPTINRNHIHSLTIRFPQLITQQKIASILSNYDDLIENNTKRIEILEQMAKLVYEEWFIKFRFPGHEKVKMVYSELGEIPEGWRIDKLEKIASVNELSLKKGEEPQEINYVDISSVTTGKIDETKFIAYSDAPSRARRIVKHGDIIWSTVRPNRKSFALILNPLPNLIVSTGFAVITAKSIPYTYLYHTLTADDFVGYLTNNATGAAYPAVNSDDFKNANILVPTDDLLDQFNKIVSNLFNLKHNLLDKNQNLRKTRDLLLPKLISGEVDVSDLDIHIKYEYQESNFNFGKPQDEKGLRVKMV
jgi:type I restriction enzyme, S subunit